MRETRDVEHRTKLMQELLDTCWCITDQAMPCNLCRALGVAVGEKSRFDRLIDLLIDPDNDVNSIKVMASNGIGFTVSNHRSLLKHDKRYCNICPGMYTDEKLAVYGVYIGRGTSYACADRGHLVRNIERHAESIA